MKKIKFIALALVLMLGLIGGAYAAWSETLTIDGTVETGKLEHQWWVHAWSAQAPNSSVEVVNGGWNQWLPVGQHPVVVFHNLQPAAPWPANLGWECRFSAQIHNKGTVPSKVKEFKITPTGNLELWNYVQLMGGFHRKPASGPGDGYFCEIGSWSTPAAFLAALNAAVGKPAGVLKPGQYHVLDMEEYPDDESSIWVRLSPNTPQHLMGESVGFTLEVIYEQAVQ